MEKDKKMIVTFKPTIHKRLKVESAKSGKAMNLIVNEKLDKTLPQHWEEMLEANRELKRKVK